MELMKLMKKLSSKNIFVFSFVLIGVVFGFLLAFFSFPYWKPNMNITAQAEESRAVVIPADALSVAEGLQNAFRSVSDKVLPSVVEINTVSVTKRQTPRFNGIPWDFFFGPENDNGDSSEEREYRSQGLGSGIIVRQDKDTYYVLTNNHVIDGATEIFVVMSAGKEHPAVLVGKDDRKDIAMISFKTTDSWPIAVLGDSDAVKVGDWAIAVGNPLGYMSSVTMGIVSAVGRSGGPANNINDFIQTDASINQGNSGGALVNIRGEVIGVNTWIATNNGSGSMGLGFAIPINNVKRSIDEFISKGAISYGWLGVSLVNADKDLLKALGVPEGQRGAFASQVFLDSPADKGGIRAGDFITAVNGRDVRDMNHLTLMVGDLKPGDKAEFALFRDGAAQNLTVSIEERTNDVASDNKKLWPGVYVLPITTELRDALKLDRNARGLYVAQVYTQTPASVIGLQRGDRILAVNDKQVNDLTSFYKVLREDTGKELWFSFIRGEATLESPKFKR
ncbi:MAG: Do family serine endopeptidase [Treponema sp.]|jgi:Do/DeqQ family serine protease|nr:Do family serine endopeptidase [Treponema sp.]